MFRGIIPPLVTPLGAADELDEAGFCRLIDHVIRGGVHGIFVLGTTGEGPSLSGRLQRRVIEVATQQAAGRVPVLVGITHPSYAESMRLADHAAQCGASAVVLAAPYYFPASQDELLGYLSAIVPALPLPVMLYNMPSMTKLVFEPETVRTALSWPNCVGVKDSSGDIEYFRKIVAIAQTRQDFSVLIGPEHLLVQSLQLGGHGGVHGGANVLPQLIVSLYNDVLSGSGIEDQQQQLLQLGQIYRIGANPASSVIRSIKSALSLMEICDAQMAPPFHAFNAAEREQVQRVLATLMDAAGGSLHLPLRDGTGRGRP